MMITNIFYWVRNNIGRVELEIVVKGLEILREGVFNSTSNFRNNLRMNNFLGIISEISESNSNQQIQLICNSIIEAIVNEDNTSKINSGKIFSETNLKNSNMKKNLLTSGNSKINLHMSLKNEKLENKINKHNQNSNITNESKPWQVFPEIKIFNFIPTFPQVIVGNQEEQIFFDTNINLKFGDYLQISKNLYLIYYKLTEDFPVEYFLQNSELIKSLLSLLEKAEFYEYGIVLTNIMERIFILLERKIQFYKESYVNINEKSNDTTLVREHGYNLDHNCNDRHTEFLQLQYPPVENYGYLPSTVITTPTLSVRDFLTLSFQSLLQGMYDKKKFPFYFRLLENNFEILKKIIVKPSVNINKESDIEETENMAIIFDLMTRLNQVIQFYFKANSKESTPGVYNCLCKFYVNVLISLKDDYLLKLFGFYLPDIIYIIKDVIFIFEDYNDKHLKIFKDRIANMISLIESSKQNNTTLYIKILNEMKSNFIDDLENSERILKSIEVFQKFKNINNNNQYDYEGIIENFEEVLIAFKFLLESGKYSEEGDPSESDQIIQNFSFMTILSKAYNSLKTNNVIDQVTSCFRKLLTFINTLTNDSEFDFKFSFYKNFRNQLNEDEYGKSSEIITKIINTDLSTFLMFVNELTNTFESENINYNEYNPSLCNNTNENISNLIYDIIYTLLCQASNNSENTKNSALNNLHLLECFSVLVPLNIQNLKIKSLHSKIDYKLVETEFGSNGRSLIFLKYLRLLFSKDEMIRLNCINYFKMFDSRELIKGKIFKTIDFINFSINYEQLKQLDTIFLLQSAEKEIPNLIKNIVTNSELDIELFPLLNIFYSDKIELNLKSSTVEQMCYLASVKKYRKIFIEVFEFALDKLNETFASIGIMNCDKEVIIQNDKLSYLQNLLKLVLLIVIFLNDEKLVKHVMCIKDLEDLSHSKILDLISALFRILFSKNFQNKNKHLLGVYSISFLSLVAFNSANLPKEVLLSLEDSTVSNFNEDKEKVKILNIPKIFEKVYNLNFLPFKTFSKFNFSRIQTDFLKLMGCTSNKYTINYIKSKGSIINLNSKIFNNSTNHIKQIKTNIRNTIKEFKSINYLKVYLNLCDFFNSILNESLTNKSFSNTENYLEEFHLIFAYFRKIQPIKPEEKNLISDFLSVFQRFIKFSGILKFSNYYQLITKALNDIVENLISFITNGGGMKQFIEGLNKPWAENQIFLIELCNLLIQKQEIFNDRRFTFILKNNKVFLKFLETFSNLFLLDESFLPIRLLLLKVENIFYELFIEMSSSKADKTHTEETVPTVFEKFLTNSLNSLDFYLGKYNLNSQSENHSSSIKFYNDIGFITEILKYYNKITWSIDLNLQEVH